MNQYLGVCCLVLGESICLLSFGIPLKQCLWWAFGLLSDDRSHVGWYVFRGVSVLCLRIEELCRVWASYMHFLGLFLVNSCGFDWVMSDHLSFGV